MGCFRRPCFICGNMNAEICDGFCGTCGTYYEEESCETKEVGSEAQNQEELTGTQTATSSGTDTTGVH